MCVLFWGLWVIPFQLYTRTTAAGAFRSMDSANAVNYTNLSNNLQYLERRISSLEQPVWKISEHNLRWVACNGGPCTCTPPSFAVNCYRLSLDRIPEGQTIPKDAVTLDVGSNEICSLNRNVFKDLQRLIQLDFSNNGLQYLPVNILDGLGSLKHLLLQRNRIESLHENIFKDLSRLETLDLSENLLTKFSLRQWQGLNSLISLQLSTNQIEMWETSTDTLPNLEILDLSLNSINHLRKISQKRLRTLKLSNNRLSLLESDAFHTLIKLENVNLRQNKLELLSPSLFQGLNYLLKLDFSDNLVTDVSEYLWRDLKALKELDLQRNQLEQLRNGTFLHLTSLERLVLTGNNIEVVEMGAFLGLGNLTSLLLTNNMIEKLDKATFKSMRNLTRLDLDTNQLENLEEDTLEELPFLKQIRIGKNAWNCDCKILYLANWIRDRSRTVSDDEPKCSSPNHLAGRNLHGITFVDVCARDGL